MQLIAIIGLQHQPKVTLTQSLIDVLSVKSKRIALIDNSDTSQWLDGVTYHRLAGGCVCCSLAAALPPLVWDLDADFAVMPVSSSADPEALALMLDHLRSEHIQITMVSLIDNLTQTHYPHLAKNLESYSDLQVYEPFEYEEAPYAILRLSL